jgi:hypothetical protein
MLVLLVPHAIPSKGNVQVNHVNNLTVNEGNRHDSHKAKIRVSRIKIKINKPVNKDNSYHN